VDDHGIVRDGVARILEKQGHMQVVGTAATGKEAIAVAASVEPDVIIMDLVLPELSGVDATQRILTLLPQTRVIILSVCNTSEHVFRALRAGARGYVSKEAVGAELVSAIEAVVVGATFLSPRITEVVVAGLLQKTELHSPLDRLSGREREVLHLTAGGSSSAEIARRLSLSRKTVDTYRSRLMEKLGIADRTGLIHFAIEHAMTPG